MHWHLCVLIVFLIYMFSMHNDFHSQIGLGCVCLGGVFAENKELPWKYKIRCLGVFTIQTLDNLSFFFSQENKIPHPHALCSVKEGKAWPGLIGICVFLSPGPVFDDGKERRESSNSKTWKTRKIKLSKRKDTTPDPSPQIYRNQERKKENLFSAFS